MSTTAEAVSRSIPNTVASPAIDPILVTAREVTIWWMIALSTDSAPIANLRSCSEATGFTNGISSPVSSISDSAGGTGLHTNELRLAPIRIN